MSVSSRMDFFRETLDNFPAGCQIISPDWTYLYVNEVVCRQARKNFEELIGRSMSEVFPGIEKTAMFALLRRCMETGEPSRGENEFKFSDGSSAWFDLSVAPIAEGILIFTNDITEHKQQEEHVTRLNRLYAFLSNVNQAVFRYRDLDELFEKTCRIAVDDGGFALAWIGLTEDSGSKVIPVASAGKSAEYLEKMTEWADLCRKCRTLASLREGNQVICNLLQSAGNKFPCHELAFKLGLRSSASFPLKHEGRVQGFITLYSHQEGIFDSNAIKLLDELAMNLSFAMEFAEKENKRAEAEQALRKSEELFSKAFYLCPDAINVHRIEDGVFVSVSRGFTNITGYSEQELIGKTTLDVNLWKDPAGRKKLYDGVKERGIVENLETDLCTKSGDIRQVSISVSAIDIDQVPHFVGIVHDITESKRTEKALFAEQEKLAVTLRSIGDAVIATDLEGRITLMNKMAEIMCDFSSPEAMGRPLREVFPLVDEFTREPCSNPVEKVLETDSIIELENHTILVRRNGTELIVADSAAPIKSLDGTTVGVVLVFRDQTEKKKMLDHLNRTQRLDSLGVLAGGIAHDFNNLLGGIFGYVQLAEMECQENSRVTGWLAEATGLIARARDLTGQLLTFSKGGKPARKPNALKPILRKSTSFALSGSNVSCNFSISEDLALCFIDENQIGQVIDNIVLNALQAMPTGGAITISAENATAADLPAGTKRGDGYVKITIADTGIGIPREIMPRIFDPFFTTKPHGNGLGLSTCYSIISNHDGMIDVYSLPGKGTTFRILLPIAQSEAEQPTATIGNLHRGAGNILIMDDQEFIIDVAQVMLRKMGYTVFSAKDAESVHKLVLDSMEQGRPFAAVFLDLTIPGGLGGREIIGNLRAVSSDLPVFALSGYSEDPAISAPQKFGFTDSIRKPFQLAELSGLLNKHLPSGIRT